MIGVLTLCRDAVGAFYTQPADWATGHSMVGVLPLCRDAVGVFYSPPANRATEMLRFFFVKFGTEISNWLIDFNNLLSRPGLF